MRFLLNFLVLFAPVILFAQEQKAPVLQQPDTGYFRSFDGTRIYYEVIGKGRPVVLIHGFIVSSNSWKHTALYSDLVSKGFKVVTLDLRGNGKSDKPLTEQGYADDAEARDIMGLTRYLHLGKYYAVGYSRGSIIAARLLVKDKRIRKAVLGGMGADFTNPNWPRRIQFYEALSGKPVRELESMVQYVKQQGLDTMALAYMQKYQPWTSPGALYQVRQRVLVICGDKDADNGSASALTRMMKNATMVTVPGDHNNASRTREFADAVISFLE